MEVQTLLNFLEKIKEILHDSPKACETLDLVKAKIAFMPKKIGTVLRVRQIIDKDNLFCGTHEELDRYVDYVKQAQAKELGIFCHKNDMIKTSVDQDVGLFHGEVGQVIQSEIEILTTGASKLTLDSSVNASKSNPVDL